MMSASPVATPVTVALLVTVAIVVFDDDHEAWVVTTCVVPFDSAAVAANCDAVPTAGAAPVTETDVTVGEGVVGEDLLQAAAAATAQRPTVHFNARVRAIDAPSVRGIAIIGLEAPSRDWRIWAIY